MNIKEFKGINNQEDTKRLGFGTLLAGTNIDIDDSNNIRRRSGYSLTKSYTDITASFMYYIIDSGNLINLKTDTVIGTGFGSDKYHWCFDSNRIVLYGYKKGYIENNSFINMSIPTPVLSNDTAGRKYVSAVYKNEHGLTGGASTPVSSDGNTAVPPLADHTAILYETTEDGQVLYTKFTIPLDEKQIGSYPPPDNAVAIEAYKSQLYVAEYLRQEEKTVVWFSQPFMYHRFFKQADYFVVPDKVTNLVSTEQYLIVTTDKNIYRYDGNTLVTLTEYGAPAGSAHFTHQDKRVFLFTHKGICRIDEFQNLTFEEYIPANTGTVVSHIIKTNGFDKFITITRN